MLIVLFFWIFGLPDWASRRKANQRSAIYPRTMATAQSGPPYLLSDLLFVVYEATYSVLRTVLYLVVVWRRSGVCWSSAGLVPTVMDGWMDGHGQLISFPILFYPSTGNTRPTNNPPAAASNQVLAGDPLCLSKANKLLLKLSLGCLHVAGPVISLFMGQWLSRCSILRPGVCWAV